LARRALGSPDLPSAGAAEAFIIEDAEEEEETGHA
jgi:hypothetical protein